MGSTPPRALGLSVHPTGLWPVGKAGVRCPGQVESETLRAEEGEVGWGAPFMGWGRRRAAHKRANQPPNLGLFSFSLHN